MTEKRVTNSELHLMRLDEQDAEREDEPGILEIFPDALRDADEDAPLERELDE
jgi:hypothetical protein